MPTPIIIFHHGLFVVGEPPEILPAAIDIAHEQMEALKTSGLMDAASEIRVGINGTYEDSGVFVESLFPKKAHVKYHTTACRNEARTILMIEEWVKNHDGEACILYEHQKGCTHPAGDAMRTAWRQCSMKHLVTNWRKCVEALESVDSVGCHFMCPPQTPPTQYIWAGNFFWSRASFLRTLPSIMERARIKQSGIDALESRYESEVWIGNGPRPPTVKDFCPNWNPGRPHSV